MLKKILLLILLSTTILPKDYIYQKNMRIDELLKKLDFSICTLDGLECYEHIKFINQNNFGHSIGFYYIEKNTNIYKFKVLDKPFMFLEVERETDAGNTNRRRNTR